jgi:outer membrane protein assembly factor BamB
MNLKYLSIIISIIILLNIFTLTLPVINAPYPSLDGSSGFENSPWPMFSCNAQRTGLSPFNTSGNPGILKWSFPTSFMIQSSPVIDSKGIIYIHDNNNILYAIYPNGTEKWNITLVGIRDTPAIDSDGTIYIGSHFNKFYAINQDGTEKWTFSTNGPVKSSPVVDSNGIIYFGTSGGVSPYALLYALNPNGTEKWNFATSSGGQTGSPGIGLDGTVYVGSDDFRLYAINSDGTEQWNFLANSNVQTAPAIDLDGTIYAGSHDHNLYAIHPNGTVKWKFTTGDNIGWGTSAAIDSHGTIYINSDDKYLYAINPDGSEKWKITTGYGFTAPSISNDGTIYVGSNDNNLYAINPDGTEKWNFTTGWWVHSSPGIGSDGTIYVGSWDKNLYAIGNPNIPPTANAGPDQTLNEGDTVHFNALASYDPDGTIVSYEWDFDANDGLWWETGAIPDAIGPTPTHIYGDDGIFVATLRVTDNDNLSAMDICNVTVLNVDPTVEIESATMQVEIGLRVAGRKFNDVGMTLYENGTSIGYVSIERLPGSPNEQMVWIPMTLDLTKTYSATVAYIPEDPPNIGANPVWIYIMSENGSVNKIHHTFNVQQSKKRDSDHWNHIEPWEVDLNPHLSGLPFEITSHITDPGSDDETLTYTYGSQIVTVEYLNNPPNPDPYPSPEVNPRDIIDATILVYEGPQTIILVVEDDDIGSAIITMDIV